MSWSKIVKKTSTSKAGRRFTGKVEDHTKAEDSIDDKEAAKLVVGKR